MWMKDRVMETRLKSSAVGWHAFFGFLFGYFILHPVSMAIFQWLEPAFWPGMPEMQNMALWETALLSFRPAMFKMGMVYGLLTSMIAAANGYQRMTIRIQKDQ